MKKVYFIYNCLLGLFLIATSAYATLPIWQIVPDKSSLTFTATQNDAPVTGEFKTFSGEIHFDPKQLESSYLKIIVDMNSVTTSYKDVEDTLKTSDWFNIKLFPQAIFTAKKFTAVENNRYKANGALTIRDKTLPIELDFTLDEYSAEKAQAKGTATLQRTAFGVGQGEWASTEDVKDKVDINFIITAMKKQG